MPVEPAPENKLGPQASNLFDSHSEQGLAQFKADRFDDAVLSFQKALELRRDPGTLHNLGVAFAKLGKLDEAIATFREALQLNPRSLTAHKNLGLALHQQGKLAEAAVHYAQAADLDPASAAAHHDLGRVLFEAGRFEEAVARFRQAIQLEPRLWTAHHDLGRCLVKLGRKEEAIASYEEAVQIKPDAADVHNNLGILLENTRKYPEAIECFRRALRFNPNSTETHSNMGVALVGLGKLPEAVASYREALRIAPRSPEAHNNLGNALRTLGNLNESLFHLEEAIRLMPGYAEAYNNLGITRLQMGDSSAAIAAYGRALELKPDYAEARLNRALALLAQGDMDQGWREYEGRWHSSGLQRRSFPQPEWAGEPLPEGSVLLYTEQGMGDTLQFIRYAPLVKERVGTVILEVPGALFNVVKRCPGISQFIPQGQPLPEFTAHCPLLSLPRVFQTTLETIPAPIPYIVPDPERVTRWQQVLRSLPGLKIGIGWQGNREFRGDRQRSLALRFFAPLAAVPRATLVSLQKGEGERQAEEVAEQFLVHKLPGLDEEGGAFVDTAAVMSQLDLVVTSDTAVAHLAGALGVPVWVVLSAAADWRWLRQRDDSPWYPTMRLFRQKELGDWPELFERVARAAAQHLQDKTPSPDGAAGAEARPQEGLYRRGLEHLQRGRWSQGAPLLREVLRHQPDHAAAQHNLGVALAKLGKWNEAVTLFEELLKRKPRMADAHNNLGLAYLDGGKPEKAEPAFRQAARLKPSSADVKNNLGVSLARQNRLEDAAATYRQALVLRPDYAEAHANLGHALRLLGRLHEARHHAEQACNLRPDCAEAHNNRGLVHRDLGDLEAAMACYQRALELAPEHAEARLNRALAWLAQGDFSRGWPEYEWRWRVPSKRVRSFPVPQWDGSPLAGRRILLHTEQGLGDVLQFIRFAPLVQARGGRVVLEAPRELVAILSDCPGIDQLVVQGTPLPDFPVHCPLLSLPYVLQTQLKSLPAAVPYLRAHPRRLAKWRGRLQSLQGFKVGIAWQGNPTYPGDRQRSPGLEHFTALARTPGLQLVSLQKGPGSEQVSGLKGNLPLHELSGLDADGNAFMDTAAVMKLLDLVVTSDTAVVHLAGALGVPVWVLLPFAADWRWLCGRSDSPWYPTMRLFRQNEPGDWPGVFHRVTAALGEATEATRGRPSARTTPAGNPDDLYQRGLRLLSQGQWAEGEACLRGVLEQQPARWAAHLNLGVALARQKKVHEAISRFQRYLAAQPQSVEGHNNLGLARLELRQFAEAEKAFLEATRLQPGNSDYHNNYGVCLIRQDKLDEAVAAFQKALSCNPDKPTALMNLAHALRSKKEYARAVDLYSEALRLRPDDVETLCNLGKAHSEMGDRAKAAACYRKAVELNPRFADAHNNLGVALADLNQVAEAEHHLRQAVELRPEHGETHRNLAIIQLMAGKFQEGWKEYEWRWRCGIPEPRAKTCPRWEGTPLAGRTLLLHPEQGLGDALQFIRYAPLVKQLGGTVIVECPRVLASLLQGQPGLDQVIPQGSPLPRVDVAAPLLSLPFLFGTTLETVPNRVPYLHADPERVAAWRHALRHVGGYKVAIAWQGSPKYSGDRQRSIPLSYFAPLADIPGVQLLSLQKGFGVEQLGATARQFVPLVLDRQIDEDGQAFVDSAAVIQLADLVITSDTALAHLAGALGVPVWLVLHFAGDWRWLRGRDDSPWYPTMRLFRQETSGDWQGVFERVAGALRERLQEKLVQELIGPNTSDMRPIPAPLPPALAVLSVQACAAVEGEIPGPHLPECQWQTRDLLGDPDAARRIGFCRADVAGVARSNGAAHPPELANRPAAVSQAPVPLALQDENSRAGPDGRPLQQSALQLYDWLFSNFETFDVANPLAEDASSALLGRPATERGVDDDRDST
jgi:tetratricopeptide (TPR) repeat protein